MPYLLLSKPLQTADDVLDKLEVWGEDLTDELIELAIERMPSTIRIWKIPIPMPKGIIRRLLDDALPQIPLNLLREVMYKRGWVTHGPRWKGSPFDPDKGDA